MKDTAQKCENRSKSDGTQKETDFEFVDLFEQLRGALVDLLGECLLVLFPRLPDAISDRER